MAANPYTAGPSPTPGDVAQWEQEAANVYWNIRAKKRIGANDALTLRLMSEILALCAEVHRYRDQEVLATVAAAVERRTAGGQP